MTFAELYALFLARCRKRCKPRTVKFYETRFKPWLREFGSRPVASITPLEAWKKECQVFADEVLAGRA